MEDYYHGSNSGSLIGVFDVNKPGLRYLGKLLKEGIVPYCGELEWGIAKDGVSLVALSVVIPATVKVAVRYAKNFLKPWNPEIGIENLRSARNSQQNLERKIAEGNTPEYIKAVAKMHKLRAEIEERRLAGWNGLTDEEKEMVTNPFPVIYGINYKGPTKWVRSECPGEEGIQKTILPNNLAAYVASSTLEKTKIYAGKFNTAIYPFRELLNITPLALDCEWAINDIIKSFP